jgi:hypothetical protein
MLGFRFTCNQPHQQSWWSDGSPRLVLPQARLPQSASDRNRQQSVAAALTASIFSAL